MSVFIRSKIILECLIRKAFPKKKKMSFLIYNLILKGVYDL